MCNVTFACARAKQDPRRHMHALTRSAAHWCARDNTGGSHGKSGARRGGTSGKSSSTATSTTLPHTMRHHTTPSQWFQNKPYPRRSSGSFSMCNASNAFMPLPPPAPLVLPPPPAAALEAALPPVEHPPAALRLRIVFSK